MFNTMNVFGSVFLACEVGQRFTDLFEEINDILDRLNWYLFPNKLQRLLPTVLVNAQVTFFVSFALN